MYLTTLLRIRFAEAGWLSFVILAILPCILFRSWGQTILYWIAVLFILVVLENIAKRAVLEDRDAY